MDEVQKTILTVVITAIPSLLGGYFTAVMYQRVRSINKFCDLVLKEIKEVSELSDNIGGEHGLEKWLTSSQRRVAAYAKIIDWEKYIRGHDVLQACKSYGSGRESLEYRREDALEDLTTIYKMAKNKA
jgi:hypothetical protein